MNAIATDLTLEQLAAQINEAHYAFESSARGRVQHAARAGQLLLKARQLCPHKTWLPWLRDNFRGSQPTASRYMTVAQGLPTVEANYSSVNNLTLTGLVKLINGNGGAEDIEPEEQPTHPAPSYETEVCNDLSALVATGRKFGTVYADPPWQYGNQATRSSTDNHYGTMPLADICALPVADLADEPSHLHLWTTSGFLFDAKRVIDAWGFQYKSMFVWAKPQLGIGNYWRLSHEILLTAVRGSLTFADRSLKSWAELDRTSHSTKPEQVRGMVERASPGPRLELFARRTAPGWVSFGNQVERSMFDREELKVS